MGEPEDFDGNDTAPEVAALVHERMMRLSGEERMRVASSMFDAARTLVLASLPESLTEDEPRRELCRRLYGIELPPAEPGSPALR